VSALQSRRLVFLASTLALLTLIGSIPAAGQDLEKDPSKGEYYTNEEIMDLGAGDRNRYCEAMETLLKEFKEETEFLQSRLDSLDAQVDSLRKASVEVSSEIRSINTELRDLRLRRKSIESYTTLPGDDLRKISKLMYGDPTHWRDIYEANKDKVASEEAELLPGTSLKIPRSRK